MKASTFLLIGGAAIALLYFGNLGQAGNVLEFYISGVNFTGITTGQITLMVQNPSNANIMLNSMAGTITANNTTDPTQAVTIGNLSNFQGGVSIPSNQQVPVTINVALSLTNVLTTLYTALVSGSGTSPINFVIAGNANINGGIIVPFNINQTVNV